MKKNRTLVLSCIFAFIIGGGMIGFCIGKSGKGQVKPQYEYSFNVDQQGYDVYDNGISVGRINYGSSLSLDSLINLDNQ